MSEINQDNVTTTVTIDEYGVVSIYAHEGMDAPEIWKDICSIIEYLQFCGVPHIQKLLQNAER